MQGFNRGTSSDLTDDTSWFSKQWHQFIPYPSQWRKVPIALHPRRHWVSSDIFHFCQESECVIWMYVVLTGLFLTTHESEYLFMFFFYLVQIYCKFTSKFGFTLLWRSFLLSNWANIWFNITSTQELKIHFYIPYKMQNKTLYLYIPTRSKIFLIYWDGKILWTKGYLFSRSLKCCHKLTSHFREKLNT